MGTSQNYLGARAQTAEFLLRDAVHEARRIATVARAPRSPRSEDRIALATRANLKELVAKIPRTWPALPQFRWPDHGDFKKLLKIARDDPANPINWHRRRVNEQLDSPQEWKAYFEIRRALWEWDEFAPLRRGARAILEAVIELARSEALPWFVAVPAEHVRRIARLCEKNYAECVRELECLAITRPARMARIANRNGTPNFPGTINPRDPLMPIAQWLIRYRRGIPWNKKRAAWWINYDLLCGTGRVLPGFVVSPRTLNKTYQHRNRAMGRIKCSWAMSNDDDAFLAMEEALTKTGPLPPPGLRAPLWCDWREMNNACARA